MFETVNKRKLKKLLEPVKDAVDDLLLVLREGAIDLLKKCNENDSAAAGVCAKKSTMMNFPELIPH